MNDQQRIQQVLRDLTEEYNFSVLLAVESGSRAWGFASEDSDFDIRFVYCHPVKWYLSLEKRKDHCDLFLPGKLDLMGWDIRKALNLLAGSNPGLVEWIYSPVVYFRDAEVHEELKQLASECFCRATFIHHYLHIALKICRGWDPSKELSLKKTLYVLRSVVNCKYIENHRKPPPVPLEESVQQCVDDARIRGLIFEMIRLKKAGTEKEFMQIPPELLVFIQSGLEYYSNAVNNIPKRNSIPRDRLNAFFIKLIE